jgi:hypothetical protein
MKDKQGRINPIEELLKNNYYVKDLYFDEEDSTLNFTLEGRMRITSGFIIAMTNWGYTLEDIKNYVNDEYDATARTEEAMEAEREELVPRFVRTLVRFRSCKSYRSAKSAATKSDKKETVVIDESSSQARHTNADKDDSDVVQNEGAAS